MATGVELLHGAVGASYLHVTREAGIVSTRTRTTINCEPPISAFVVTSSAFRMPLAAPQCARARGPGAEPRVPTPGRAGGAAAGVRGRREPGTGSAEAGASGADVLASRAASTAGGRVRVAGWGAGAGTKRVSERVRDAKCSRTKMSCSAAPLYNKANPYHQLATYLAPANRGPGRPGELAQR